MESNSIFKSLLSLLFFVLIIGGAYYLNGKYKWINFDSTTIKDDYNKVNIADLSFDNKAYIKNIIGTNNIDINVSLTNDKVTIKENVLKNLTTLNNTMKNKIDSEKKKVLNKDVVTSNDINNYAKYLLNAAYDYNNTLSELGNGVDYNLYTIIVDSMTLLDHYYIDSIENTYIIDVNYAYLYNIFKYKLDSSGKSYCVLKDNIHKCTNSNYLYKDGSLVLSWSDFEEIILLYDEYMYKYSDNSIALKEYDNLFDFYMGKTLLPNSSIYETDGVKIKDMVLQTYKDIVNNHPKFSRINELKSIISE